MACVVAATDGRTVVLGGDSAGMCNTGLYLRADPTIFTDGPLAIGFTNSRMGQILRCHLDIPYPVGIGKEDLFEAFMVVEFIPDIRRALVRHGFPGTDKQHGGSLFCVGLHGTIFLIHDDFQVSCPLQPYAAMGSGAQVALGALYALHAQEEHPPPKAVVLAALEAAESLCSTVRRPFHLVETTHEREE